MDKLTEIQKVLQKALQKLETGEDVMNKSLLHAIACRALLPLSMILCFVILWGNDIVNRTFSGIGRDYPTIFLVYCFVIATGFWINMRLLAKRLNIKHKLFHIILFIGILGMVATPLTLEETPIWQTIHVAMGAVFIFFGLTMFLFALFIKAKRSRSKLPYASMFTVFVLAMTMGIFMHGFFAIWQMITINVTFIFLFTVNHIERWSDQQAFAHSTVDQEIDSFS